MAEAMLRGGERLTGQGSAGQLQLAHPGFTKLAFTGSTEVGYTIADAAAKKLVPATLELGGKSANIIFPDAPWEKALEGLQIGILFNQGQVCCAGSRVFVHESVYDKFLAEAVAAFQKIKVGLPWEPDTIMGSQVNQIQRRRSCYVEWARRRGPVHTRCPATVPPGQAFMLPTILPTCTRHAGGPGGNLRARGSASSSARTRRVVPCQPKRLRPWRAVWTWDINRAFRWPGVETAACGPTTTNQLRPRPFAGYKKSGIGRETHK